MTQQQYLEYIQRQLSILTKSKRPKEAIAYQLGFLQAQLAWAMYNDTRVAHEFKDRLQHLGYTKPKE